MTTKNKWQTALFAATALATGTVSAMAADPAPAAPAAWIDTMKFGLQIEGGVMGNPASPTHGSGGNFGQLFTDKANDPLLNQVLFGVGRPLDPKATGYDFGFKLQGMFGTDARYTRWYNFGTGQTGRYQADLVEANVLLHAPVLTEGGIDFKAGMYSTPMGAETIDPSTNVFYSKSYIFNFGLPLKHTGLLTTTHATDMIDIYLGVDSGVNTTVGPYTGDNNSSYSGMVGFGLNLLDGNLTVLALSHIGPEDTGKALAAGGGFVPLANRYNRYINDVVVTWKATDKWTLITELNYVADETPAFNKPTAFGIAQYATYAVSDSLSASVRGEIFNDDKNFYVAAFPGNNDFNNAFSGRPATVIGVNSTKGTTYGALTLGVTYKPALDDYKVPGTLMIRPELRYDAALNSNKPYNGGKDSGQFTIGADVVLTF